MELIVYDEEWNPLETWDTDLGRLEPRKRLIAHHEADPGQEYIEKYDLEHPIKVYPNGGKEVPIVVVQEYRPPRDAWDECEDCWVYIPYTQEELAGIAARKEAEETARKEAEAAAAEAAKKAAEREVFLAEAPARVDAIEATTLDHDEALAILYEAQTTAQLDTAEAIVTLYEAMNGGTA